MSVIIVSKKKHNTFKFFTMLFAIVAVVSLGWNIKMVIDINTYKTAYHTVTERLSTTHNELQDTIKEKEQLANTVEKRKIAMIRESKETECLATNVYFEAGGEGVDGKSAVAHVTLNRMKHPSFPKTACGVVYQGANTGSKGCQFSWACNGMNKAIRVGSTAWEDSKRIAIAVLAGKKHDVTEGALYFHNSTVRPAWATPAKFTTQIGGHRFYK